MRSCVAVECGLVQQFHNKNATKETNTWKN